MTIETPAEALPTPPSMDAEVAAPGSDLAAPAEAPVSLWPDWAPAMPELGPDDRLPRDPQSLTFEELTAAIDTPAERPTDYRLPPLDVASADGEPNPAELQALAGIRSLLWHGSFPVNDGNSLMTAIANESKRLGEHMDEATFALHERQSDAALRGIYGDRYDALRAKLEGFFDDLGRKTPGGIEPLLEANWHVLISPLVMHRLLQHVDRLEHRRRR